MEPRVRLGLCGIAAAGLFLAWTDPSRAEVEIAQTGPVETVFDWSREACVKTNVPDAPARAFRNVDGEVRLIVSHNDNRALVGTSLGTVKPDCEVLFEAGRSADLASFNDLSWISAVYTRDGRRVDALAHTELRGERTPGQCPAGAYSACLLNTVTALVSHDGGRTFAAEQHKGQPPVVATLPYPFPTDRESRVGYANPTNIVARDGWYYAFVFADRYRDQARGNCLIRTQDLADPTAWRAWDGTAFSVTFIDPFRVGSADAANHVCTPVAPHLLGRMIGGMVQLRESGEIVAVFGDKRKRADGTVEEGIFASSSRDLLAWTQPALVMGASLLWDKSCAEPSAYFYPTLIDPEAKTLSFEDMGSEGFLYLTRYQLRDCKVTWDRDLVRVPVALRSRP
ncbi:hypothetical protein [Microvirga antarctica]|uniref:hypothetical protein n=1 Tax=Microvirga antarctica TaxID=2819233 RepID=UPI001B30AF22|nr:hypothetical protein [Microvirga antarctica]